ncbi:hypothetical protein HRV97_03095 [Sphingomonas sp. HHU CXW]|uniref:SGNH hydrolase-type esterase domain-containing protein n=1 Tax=Sphingomonas hominis TaxID=2741495 RepID=A0ABX2JDG4_9SPHN|nr:hypothetical protein [Sphingomonas hominis]NTS64147.1 hypothetical protein [Sphingomonas hominis]
MPDTTARLDLSVWRNDDIYEFPLRVVGVDLSGEPGVALAMQVRLGPDTPGAPLVDLIKVTNGNAEGLRVAGVTVIDGAPVSDVRIRINKSTRQALPYAGEVGDSAPLSYALLIAGVTRLVGSFIVLAHTYGSDNAPASRPTGYGATSTTSGVSSGATLTISQDGGATLVIDGAAIVAAAAARAEAAAASVVAAQRVLTDSHLADLYRNLWPETIAFGPGECIMDSANLYGGGQGFYVPRSIEVRRGDTIYTADPVSNGESASVGGHVFFARAANELVTTALWYDARDNSYQYNQIGFLTQALAAGYSKIVPLAVFPPRTGLIHSPVAWRRSTDDVAANATTWGPDITAAPVRFAAMTEVAVTDQTLLSWGVTKALKAANGRIAFVGANFPASLGQSRLFSRIAVISGVDGTFTPPQFQFYGSNGYISEVGMALDRVISPRVRTYTVSVEAPAGTRQILVGTNQGGDDRPLQGIAGWQLSYTGAPRFIRFGDYAIVAPVSAVAKGVLKPTDTTTLTGDSRMSDYDFRAPNWSSVLGCTVLARGQSGHTVAQNASNADFAAYFAGSVVPRLVVHLPGGNDLGVAGSVGTFSGTSPNGLAGEPIVTETDVTQDYAVLNASNNLSFVQAISHYIRKFRLQFYDIRARAGLTGTETEDQKNAKIAAVVSPMLVLLTDIPQKRQDGRAGDPANLERKRQAVLECAREYQVQVVDTMGELYFDMTKEVSYPPSGNPNDNAGVFFLDGLHPNAFGDRRIADFVALKTGLA